MMQVLLMLAALVLPALALMPFFHKLLRPRYPVVFVCLISFPAGWAFFTTVLFTMNLLFGVKIGLLSGMLVPLAIFVVAILVSRTIASPSEKDNAWDAPGCVIIQWKATLADRIIFLALVILSLILWVVLAFLALSSPVDCIPGFGVWGYKSLLIHDTEGIPFEVMSGAGRPFLHADYPLGYPILLAWCHLCMGQFNDQTIKLLPFLAGLLSSLLLISICVQLGVGLNVAIVFALLASASGSFVLCATSMYAELLLLLCVLPGLFLVSRGLQEGGKTRDIFPGLLLLAMSVWIKSEGLIYFSSSLILLIVISFFVGRRAIINRRFVLAVLFPTLIFIVPWTACRLIFGFDAVDFDLSKPFSSGINPCVEGLRLALLRALSHMFVNIKDSGGVWIFIFLGVVAGLIKRAFNRRTCFVLCFTIMMLFCFVSIFFFSVRPLEWHVEALPRLLLVFGSAILPYAVENFNKDHAHANA